MNLMRIPMLHCKLLLSSPILPRVRSPTGAGGAEAAADARLARTAV